MGNVQPADRQRRLYRGMSNAAFVAAFVIVVVCFTAGTAVAQQSARLIDRIADEIVSDVAPSIAHLASARSELHRLQDFAADYVANGGQAADRAEVERSLDRLEGETAAYLRLPFFPGERDAWQAVSAEIDRVRDVVEQALAVSARGDLRTARALVTVDLRSAVDAASAALVEDMNVNAMRADFDAERIKRQRRSATVVAIALDVLSSVVAATVAWFVCRLNTHHTALRNEHARVLEDKNSELELFASRLAHDVASPLASTQFAIELALRASDDERVRRPLMNGRAGVDRAAGIARALLDFARAGARPESPEQSDASAVATEVVDELLPSACQAGATIALDVPERAPVACSHGLLVSVVSNLVRNAIRYIGERPERFIRVRVSEHARTVSIEVADTGPGLPRGLGARVFDPYVRGPSAPGSGLGLGLATVKRIVEAHGGSVGVESKPCEGSTFRVELPRAARSPSTSAVRTECGRC